MPGNVAVAAPATVFPNHLCAAFSETRAWPIRESGGYTDGRYQTEAQADYSRKTWEIGKRLTFAEWSTLLTFFEARKGSQQPFYWYPLDADYDPSGVDTDGRYVVRFDGTLSRTYQRGRQESSLRLVEIE